MDSRKKDIQKAKNGYIELCRFLFCAMILIHHTAIDPEIGTILPGGFIAVEFFFFLSGAMAMRHLAGEKREIPQKMHYAMSYTLHKIKRIFPYAACGTLIAYVWRIVTVRDYTAQTWQELAVLPFELSFLPMAGLVPTRLDRYMNAPLWYVSAMFITLPLIVYLCLRAEDAFRHYIVWFVPFLIHGWMILHMGASWGWGEVTPVGFSGLLVAFSNMTMGFGVYLAAERLAGKKFGVMARVLLTVCEVGAVALCFVFAASSPETYSFEAVILFLAASLTITLSGASYTVKIHGRVWDWLGKLTLPIYCVHWWVGQIVQVYLGEYAYPLRILFTLIGALILSLPMLFIVENLPKIYQRAKMSKR